MADSITDVPHETIAPQLSPIACPRCGVIDHPAVCVGAGPHAYRAVCAHCGMHLRWLSAYSPEERRRKRQAARDAVMSRLAPTAPQLSYLAVLGDVGPPPAHMLDASERIDSLTRKARP